MSIRPVVLVKFPYVSLIKSMLLYITGIAQSELLKEMDVLKQGEHNPEEGRLFAYVYTADGDLFDTQRKAYDMFAGNNII